MSIENACSLHYYSKGACDNEAILQTNGFSACNMFMFMKDEPSEIA